MRLCEMCARDAIDFIYSHSAYIQHLDYTETKPAPESECEGRAHVKLRACMDLLTEARKNAGRSGRNPLHYIC